MKLFMYWRLRILRLEKNSFKKDYPDDHGYHSALDRYHEWFLEQYALKMEYHKENEDEN